MKLFAFAVLLALAFGVESSVLPWPLIHHPLSYTAVHGPTILAASPAVLPAAVAIHPGTIAVHAAPAVVAHPAPIVVAAAEGAYVAKTRGAVHVAPLPGHANSASSINLEPAPGTV